MYKFLIVLVLACSLQAGTIGFVEPGQHPNYSVQLPPELNNFTGISLGELLTQNPQNSFAFTNMTDSGPRDLIGYFDPVLPGLQVIWTTLAVEWKRSEPEPSALIILPPPGCEVTHTCPPIGPPVVPPCLYNCGPIVPPICEHDCHPPTCLENCNPVTPPVHPPHEPPPAEVPEPASRDTLGVSLLAFMIVVVVKARFQSQKRR